ncbi:hypothetical protein [Propionibacterium freudenreichii]|uniref:hypothetical protein n=1 Tax=Propionibacterium freudenreichii TaxID=1744 RepID=UPI00254FA770|nr:hypothetical protein [Propionibacterium freudenreichii]MDK9341387.1 hypothetical protein [Propionibacterium freudenreichii]
MTQSVIVTEYPGMWSVESPQDTIAGGRRTRRAAVRLARQLMPTAALGFAYFVTAPGGEDYKFILRDDSPQRRAVAEGLTRYLNAGRPLSPEPLPPTELNEFNVIPALPGDRYGDLRGLIGEEEPAVLANFHHLDAESVALESFLVGARSPAQVSVEDLGLTDAATFDQVLRALMAPGVAISASDPARRAIPAEMNGGRQLRPVA